MTLTNAIETGHSGHWSVEVTRASSEGPEVSTCGIRIHSDGGEVCVDSFGEARRLAGSILDAVHQAESGAFSPAVVD